MSNREIVIDLLARLPEDTPLEDIAREQARRREGIPADETRKLISA